MDVNLIFKIAAVGILVTIIQQVLKQSGRDEQAFLVSLSGLILVLFWLIPYISELFDSIRNLFSIAKEMAQEYGITPRKAASILDTFSCIFQGIIP